jgi:prepilin-type N-terminal cleavage/methylation domain-containing protein
MTPCRTYRQGNTLIEVVVATVLVGVVLVAALETLGGAARTHRKSATTAEAWTLAERYAAEIMAKPYEDPQGGVVFGTESNDGAVSTRDQLDDVDDYHNWYESPPQTSAGVDLPAYDGWSVEVIVTRCEASPGDATISEVFTDEGLKRVQVRVSDAAGWVTEFEMLRSRHGFGGHQTPLGLPQVGGVTASVSVAGGAEQLFGDQPLNEAPTP